MTVRGVLAETDVRSDVELGEELAEEADGGDDRAVGVICGGAAVVLWAAGAREYGAVQHARDDYDGGGDGPCCSATGHRRG